MKKLVLTLMAVAISFAVMAQQKVPMGNKSPFAAAKQVKNAAKDVTPEWHQIDQDVTGVNFLNTSETISTSAIRQAGKAMVIDFSATWCSWCWVMHTNGILEGIKDQLGDDVEVIWVEADPSTAAAGITGGSGSQGNWTQTSSGSTVPYPIIDDPDFTNIIGGTSVIEGFPTVVFVSASGYWCDVYGTDWGFGPYSASDAVSAIQNLLNNQPQAGVAPQSVSIDGPNVAWVGEEVGFSVNFVSVDQVTDISWTFAGGNPSTGSSSIASTTYNTPGTYTVSVTVTNTTGSTTVNKTIVARDGWAWGDEMDYTDGEGYISSIGYGGDGEIAWGVKYPSNLLSNRNYLTNVKVYVEYAGNYDLRVYQGANPTTSTLVYESTYSLTQTEQWADIEVLGGISIDQTKDLWVTFHCNGVNYPAAYCAYNGDPNSHLIDGGSGWVEIQSLASSLDNVTWMIKTVTSANAPAFNFSIAGPTSGIAQESLAFSISGPSDGTYNWTFDGGTPATATGTNVSASWNNPGTYTITVNGSRNGSSVTRTMQVTITSCNGNDGRNYNEGFESGIECWTLIDNDGDGYGWMLNSELGSSLSHTGSGSLMSASFINNVGALSPDNWAISPRIDIPSESAQIEWWSGALDANYSNDYYSVLVSTTDKNLSSFTHTIYAGENESGSFTKHSFSLNDFRGQSIYVALRHHNCTDVYWLSIDDLKITGTGNVGIDAPVNSAIDFYPNPVNNKLYISEEVAEVSIVDINGRVVITANNTKVVDMSNLSNGVYFARVTTDNGTSVKKIVKR